MSYRRTDVTTAGNRLPFGSVGAGYSSLSNASPGRGVIIYIVSTLDQEVVISLDGGVTNWGYVPVGSVVPAIVILPIGAAGAEYNGSIAVKHNGAAPTAGAISASIIRVL